MKRFLKAVLTASVFLVSCWTATVVLGASTAASSAAPPAAAASQTLREEIFERARKRKGGKEPTHLDLFNELARKGQEEAEAVVEYGKPRVVPRGAKPDIDVKGTEIVINRKRLSIGVHDIADWRAALGREDRREAAMDDVYLWDKLGISLLTVSGGKQVVQFKVILNVEPSEPWYGKMPDGSISKPPPDYRPKHAFSGYLQLDGYGIDSQTKFWEIGASVDPKRNLRCGVRDCSHPHGGFSDNADIYMRLNGASEHSNVYEFSISGSFDRSSPASARQPKRH